MATTTNLGLNLFNYGVDMDQSFEAYQLNLSGSVDSNMTLIDDYADTFADLVYSYNTPASASAASALGLASSYSGSVVSALSASASISGSFEVLYEFSGSGYPDTGTLSQSYTHLLVIGTGSIRFASASLVKVGMDFNLITASGSYSSVQWVNTGSSTGSGATISGSEAINQWDHDGIDVAHLSGCASLGNYPGMFMAFIPDYSGSGGYYKCATGISMAFIEKTDDSRWLSLSTQGGYCNSTSAITRIRFFGWNGTSHYNFENNSKITVYGIK